MLTRRTFALAVFAVLMVATPVAAQLPNVGSTAEDVLRDPVGQVTDATQNITRTTIQQLRNARELTANQLRRRHRDVIDTDRDGHLVVRSQVLAIAPRETAIAAATAAGFSVRDTVEETALGLRIVVLTAPRSMSTRRAVEALRALDPEGAYDFDHVYLGAGGDARGAKQMRAHNSDRVGPRIGLIDSGVDADHPAFRSQSITQRGFGGPAIASAHGTAVASILSDGASLYVADVYGGRPAGGSASAIVAALGWLAQARVDVINVSLVGPPNRALQAAIAAAIARGHIIVAAVGNDGPAAPPLYPAAYPGVVGVTGVDTRDRILPEAGRGPQVDFAAPGADLETAALGGGFGRVRGTSFAAPTVARLLAAQMQNADDAARAQQLLAASARDLGARGRDDVFGAGLVGATQHTARR